MASSLITLQADNDVNPPYETVDATTHDVETPSVVVTGGVISNFNDILIDNTLLDIESTKVKQFPLNVPLPIPRIGGSTNLKMDLPIDNLLNPSSINLTVVFSLMKRAGDGNLTKVEMTDGIVPVAGYYPFSNVVVSFDNSEINSPDMSNLDLTLLRNLKLMETLRDCSYADMSRLHTSHAGWHLNHQSHADSKEGLFGAYVHTDDTHVITAVNEDKTGTSLGDHCFNFQQKNVRQLLTGELIVTVEIPYTFLSKTRITPFIVKNVNFELKWVSPGNIFSQEQKVPTTVDGVWPTLQFQLQNAYIAYQNILANPALINSYSTLSPKSGDNDIITNSSIAYPSWVVKNIFKYDNKTVPPGQSSVLLSLKGRIVPEVLIIIIRRKAMIDSKIGNYRYMECPNIENIVFSSPTYSHLKYLESDRGGISMFHKSLTDISCLAEYSAKSLKIKRRIDKQLEFLTLYNSRAIRNVPLMGTTDPITSPEIFLNGHSVFTKTYRRAVMCGQGVRSKPILADIKVEIQLGKRTDQEYLIEIYGNSDAVLTVNPDRSFKISHEDSGTSVKESIKIHEKMSRVREDINLRINDV